MPAVSIIIPGYNGDKYIKRCLLSLRNQTLGDIEIIVVDDCSTDMTLQIAEQQASEDSRVRVIALPENQGRQKARKTGVVAAQGEYALFLDDDDELLPETCEQLVNEMLQNPADVLHYGIIVVAENGLSQEEADSFEEGINTDLGFVEGESVMRSVFDESWGYKQDWRITQRLFKTSLLKQAFNIMDDATINRGEDAYESFVVLSLASSANSLDTCKGYVYHYGLGTSGSSTISASEYESACKQFDISHKAILAYVEKSKTMLLRDCYVGMLHKNMELVWNEWLNRITPADKPSAAKAFASVFGQTNAARELYRCTRDRLYSFSVSGTIPATDDEAFQWMDIADTFGCKPDSTFDKRRCQYMKQAAESLARDLDDANKQKAAYENQRIRIFVSAHKQVSKPDCTCLQPVQVNSASASNRFCGYFYDDSGDNISDRNQTYCELTAQYWAWKNADADYYGFCHYRRYFNFSSKQYKENDYGEIIDDFIGKRAARRYGFDDATIARCIEGYDVVTTGFKDVSMFPEQFASVRDHYSKAPHLRVSDLDDLAGIVKSIYPDYASDVDDYLAGTKSCFCNMFIMRKSIFQDYCSWLFQILDRFSNSWDSSHYSIQGLRTPGHLAERLFNIYFNHHMRIDAGWKTKELQCVHFDSPDLPQTFNPLPPITEALDPIPIVFAANNAYVPMLATSIFSLLANAPSTRRFDIIVLSRDILYSNKVKIDTFFGAFKNASIRFVDVNNLISGYDLSTNNEHISIETYLRFLIADVLPFYDKVIYLDSDLVVRSDISAIFDLDLSDNLVGAAHDIDYLGNLNKGDDKRLEYSLDVLKMKDPYCYFQAGVMLLNLDAIRKLHSVSDWLRMANNSKFIYDDQDILNSECEGRVTYFDQSWNVLTNTFDRMNHVFSFAPASLYEEYISVRKEPKIIHFAGGIKPWNEPRSDMSAYFWEYARQTPFYEDALRALVPGPAWECIKEYAKSYVPCPISRGIRKVAGKHAPKGSFLAP